MLVREADHKRSKLQMATWSVDMRLEFPSWAGVNLSPISKGVPRLDYSAYVQLVQLCHNSPVISAKIRAVGFRPRNAGKKNLRDCCNNSIVVWIKISGELFTIKLSSLTICNIK